MKSHHITIAASLFAALFAMPAGAFETFVGEYQGSVQKVEGKYRGEPGAPCRVMIEKSDMYGGSLRFSINDEQPMLFEIRNIADAEAENSTEIKVATPNTGERLKLKTRPDGTPVYLLIMKNSAKNHTMDAISCSGLIRK